MGSGTSMTLQVREYECPMRNINSEKTHVNVGRKCYAGKLEVRSGSGRQVYQGDGI